MARRPIIAASVLLAGISLAFPSCATFATPPAPAWRVGSAASSVAEIGRASDITVAEQVSSSSRRAGAVALLGAALVVLAPGGPAAAKLKSLKSDDYSSDLSKLDSMLGKDFAQAQSETKCKTAAEGEERSFCLTQEVNELNRASAEAKGEKYVDQKGTLSKGSYGV